MKKTKLLLSLAMMCLSIAVLCFGVLAATSVTYSISGTISYEVSDVFAKINTKVFKVAGQTTTTNMQTNVDALATTALSSISGAKTTSSSSLTYVDTNQSIGVYDTTSSNEASRSFDIDIDNEYMTYYIVINIENQASKVINAQLTDETVYTNLNTANILIQNGIAKGDTKNLVVAFSLSDKTVSISGVEVSYSVEVGYIEYIDSNTTQNVLIKGDSYYYINLGYTDSTKTTSIRWRLISKDGSSAYSTFDTDKDLEISSLSGAIFLQETWIAAKSFNDGTSTDSYANSTLRTYVKDVSSYNISEVPSYIEANTNVNSDNFWILSVDEINGLLTDKVWTPTNKSSAVQWWTRDVYLDKGYQEDTYCVKYIDTSGSLITGQATEGVFYPAVRAAFQLV